MSAYHYVRWFPADYVRDTRRLSQCEHGAYFLLLNEYYLTGEALPDDDRVLCRVSLSDTLSDWLAIRPSMQKFFTIRDGKWFHTRCEAELTQAREKTEAMKRGAAITNAKRWGSPSDTLGVSPFGQQPEPEPYPESELKSKPEPPTSKALATAPRKKPRGNGSPPVTDGVWSAYSEAYEEVYHVEPKRNAKTNGQLVSFIGRIGLEEAPAVAAFFVYSRARWYIERGHSVDCLLKDAEKLRTEWATKTRVTSHKAREDDRLQGMGDMWEEIKEEFGHGKRAISPAD